MAVFELIHGAGSDGSHWDLVAAVLRAFGHEVVAPDLPAADESAGLDAYVDAALAALDPVAGRDDLVVVGHSLGGFTAPVVADRVGARLLVLVAAMVPVPGESAGQWWDATGFPAAYAAELVRRGIDPDAPFDERDVFFHDVPAALTDAVFARPPIEQAGRVMEDPFPLAAWPDVPTRFVLARHDRFFPAAFQRRVVADRLGIAADEIDAGHLPALARPVELATYLDEAWRRVGARR